MEEDRAKEVEIARQRERAPMGSSARELESYTELEGAIGGGRAGSDTHSQFAGMLGSGLQKVVLR